MDTKSKSPLVERTERLKDVEAYTMTPAEAEQFGIIGEKIIHARTQREMARDEFDGLTYEQTYLTNKRAAMSYLTPKKNDDEVRINTGTTEKRIELILNELLALNLQSSIEAFDKDDNFLQDVGETLTDMVTRTKQIESARDKRPYYYRELVTQPSVFVEELWVEEHVPDDTKKGFRIRRRCENRMIQGPQMYLGDVSLPDILFHKQPYLVKYARMSYSEAEEIFKDLNPEKWKSVKPGAYNSFVQLSTNLYRKGSLNANEVEAFWYMSYPDNEIQIYVQGIPWCDIGDRYTEYFGNLGRYHITMVGLNPYSWDFAYSKPLTQSAKTLQALDNETIRNLIRKFRQAIEPPLGVPKGKVYSRDIWNPGAMAQGVKATDFEKLVDHQGVTRSEISMFDLIEKKTNEFIGTSQTEPLQGKTQVTATELNLAQKNAIKMLGNIVLAAMRLEERMDWLRNKNLLLNYSKPVGKTVDPITNKLSSIFAKFTLNNADVGGQTGVKTVQLMDRNLTEEEQMGIYAAEQRGKQAGKPFKFNTLNIPALMDLELNFYISVMAKERDSDILDRSMFTEMLNQAVGVSQVTGRPINSNKVVEKFGRVWKEKDFFEKQAPPQFSGMGGAPEEGQDPNAPVVPKGPMGQKMADSRNGSMARRPSAKIGNAIP